MALRVWIGVSSLMSLPAVELGGTTRRLVEQGSKGTKGNRSSQSQW